MEPQVTAAHEVDNQVPERPTLERDDHGGLTPRGVCHHLHVFNVLEAVPQVANEGVINMFEHPSFPYDVPNTFGSHDCMGEDVSRRSWRQLRGGEGGDARTLILSDVFERK